MKERPVRCVRVAHLNGGVLYHVQYGRCFVFSDDHTNLQVFPFGFKFLLAAVLLLLLNGFDE